MLYTSQEFEVAVAGELDTSVAAAGGESAGTDEAHCKAEGLPCFTPGSTVATASGIKPVEEVQPGDRILTRDNGFQPVAWIGHRRIGKHKLASDPELQPVFIAKDSLGDGVPCRDMTVSPLHNLLDRSGAEDTERLRPAKCYLGRPGVSRQVGEVVTYVHLLFERHELVFADGTWTESFRPDAPVVARMQGPQRRELTEMFPKLATPGMAAFEPARPIANEVLAATN